MLLQFLFHYAVIMLYERTTCCAKCDAPFDQDAVYLNTLGYRKESGILFILVNVEINSLFKNCMKTCV